MGSPADEAGRPYSPLFPFCSTNHMTMKNPEDVSPTFWLGDRVSQGKYALPPTGTATCSTDTGKEIIK